MKINGGDKVADKELLEKKYTHLVRVYNDLVRDHNNLVEDANCLVKFLEDLSRGLQVYVLGGITIGAASIRQIEVPEGELDPGKFFCAEYHNIIIRFLQDLQAGRRPKDVYQAWVDECRKIYENFRGGY